MRRVLILLSAYCYICVLRLLHVSAYSTYVSAYYYMCAPILLYEFPHITIYVSSDYCVSAYDNIWRMPS
jgi:hypothetical protein